MYSPKYESRDRFKTWKSFIFGPSCFIQFLIKPSKALLAAKWKEGLFFCCWICKATQLLSISTNLAPDDKTYPFMGVRIFRGAFLGLFLFLWNCNYSFDLSLKRLICKIFPDCNNIWPLSPISSCTPFPFPTWVLKFCGPLLVIHEKFFFFIN